MTNKIVYSARYGGFGLSDEATKLYYEYKGDTHLLYIDSSIVRHDPDLIRVVEELGDKASGPYAELRIDEIEGNKYIIKEYDGFESVITPDDISWVEI